MILRKSQKRKVLNREEFEKRYAELLGDCTPASYAKICKLLESSVKLGGNELNCVIGVAKEARGADSYNLEYLPRHFSSLNKGESIRVAPTRFAWIKESMILMQYASQNSTRFMNNFTRLPKAERGKLPDLMECFETITSAAKKINTLTRKKKPKVTKAGDTDSQNNKIGTEEKEEAGKIVAAKKTESKKPSAAKVSKKPTKKAAVKKAEQEVVDPQEEKATVEDAAKKKTPES